MPMPLKSLPPTSFESSAATQSLSYIYLRTGEGGALCPVASLDPTPAHPSPVLATSFYHCLCNCFSVLFPQHATALSTSFNKCLFKLYSNDLKRVSFFELFGSSLRGPRRAAPPPAPTARRLQIQIQVQIFKVRSSSKT
jgi:hypothetical protein